MWNNPNLWNNSIFGNNSNRSNWGNWGNWGDFGNNNRNSSRNILKEEDIISLEMIVIIFQYLVEKYM